MAAMTPEQLAALSMYNGLLPSQAPATRQPGAPLDPQTEATFRAMGIDTAGLTSADLGIGANANPAATRQLAGGITGAAAQERGMTPAQLGALSMWGEALAPVRAAEARAAEQADPRYGMTPEQRAQFDRNQATNARFGSDLSWLDPAFQQNPALLGQSAGSQVYGDPAAIAAQERVLGDWRSVQGGQGAPSFMGNAQQTGLMDRILGQTATSGPGSLQFDSPARQAEQYGNLQGIIAGGGATDLERAARANARADSESWLRGQREADMADYAERGLTGSGMELLALNADRQGAAQRNSLADLNMAAQLEQRRMDAINAAAGLATGMRGQTAEEQGLLSNRTANALSQATGLANTMRTQDYNERTYLDERALNALREQGTLANTMRTSGTQEAQYRANAADAFAQLNQAAVNNAQAANAQHLQNAYSQMMQNRQNWEMNKLNQGLNTAGGLVNADVKETGTANVLGTQVAGQTAGQYNSAQQNYQSGLTGQYNAGQAGVTNANNAINSLYGPLGGVGGAFAEAVINGAAGSGNGGTGGMSNFFGGGGGGTINPITTLSKQGIDTQNPYTGGASSANVGVTYQPLPSSMQKNPYDDDEDK